MRLFFKDIDGNMTIMEATEVYVDHIADTDAYDVVAMSGYDDCERRYPRIVAMDVGLKEANAIVERLYRTGCYVKEG